jgi:hypothetical protein
MAVFLYPYLENGRRRKAMKTRFVNLSLLKQPSAYLPLGMALAALMLVLGHAVVFGVVHETDEGAAAHFWQLLMAGQLPFLAYFVIRWLPSRPWAGLQVLMLQATVWLANFAAVYWLT